MTLFEKDKRSCADSRGRASSDGIPFTMARRPAVWAVGGGKGGVGKSFVAVNLAVMLSRKGRSVLLVDADLGAANLHTLIAAGSAKGSISGFMKGWCVDIHEVIGRTMVPNLDIISGGTDSLDVANLNGNKLKRFKDALRTVDYEFVLLDIGPGTSNSILDLFLTAHHGVLVTVPEPTAVENTYRFIKCLFLRRMKHILESPDSSGLKPLLRDIIYNRKKKKGLTVGHVLREISERCGRERQVPGTLMNTTISIFVNQTRRAEDGTFGLLMKRACYDYFGLEVDFIGQMACDERVGESIRRRRPLVLCDDAVDLAKTMGAVVDRLIKKGTGRTGL